MSDDTNTTAKAPPRPPKGLQRAGRAFWKDLTTAYEFDVQELAILRAAARTVDRLERLALAEAALGNELTAEARGGLAVHPVLVEQRMQGQALARLIASLRIPVDTETGAGNGSGRSAYRSPRALFSIDGAV